MTRAFAKGTGMNETLRQAMFRAGLSEEAVVARLGVDPKTIRRWLEGRPPYPRLRWQLACLLAVDEAELWPGLRAARGTLAWSPEIVAVCPHLSAVPGDLWTRLARSAVRDVGVLAGSGLRLARDRGLVTLLRSQAGAGVRVRIALADPEQADDDGQARGRGSG